MEFPFPARFSCLLDVYTFVLEADVTHLTPAFRWDALGFSLDGLLLEGTYTDDRGEACVFQLQMDHDASLGVLRYTVVHLDALGGVEERMRNAIRTEFLPAFHRFPASYGEA